MMNAYFVDYDNDYYLFDYENVNCDGIHYIFDNFTIKPTDVIILFYSNKCETIHIDAMKRILQNNVRVIVEKAIVGTSDALDFQLSTALGNLICKTKATKRYHIVSNDKGFDCVCKYWREKGINVNRIKTNNNAKNTISMCEIDELLKDELIQIKITQSMLINILEIVNMYDTKIEINNALNQHFGNHQIGSHIYRRLKPLLSEKNKT